MLTLLKIAEKHNIIVDEFDLEDYFLGLYIKTTGARPVTFLHKGLPYLAPITRCVLAEELGHHFTMSGNSIYHHANYQNQIRVNKIELAAMRWAGKVLIPDRELWAALNKGVHSQYYLAKHFNVTEEFIQYRLKFFREEEYHLRHGSLWQRMSATTLLGGFNTF